MMYPELEKIKSVDKAMIRRLAERMGWTIRRGGNYFMGANGVPVPKLTAKPSTWNPLTSDADMMGLWRWAVMPKKEGGGGFYVGADHYPSGNIEITIFSEDDQVANIIRRDGDLNRAVVEAIDKACEGGNDHAVE